MEYEQVTVGIISLLMARVTAIDPDSWAVLEQEAGLSLLRGANGNP